MLEHQAWEVSKSFVLRFPLSQTFKFSMCRLGNRSLFLLLDILKQERRTTGHCALSDGKFLHGLGCDDFDVYVCKTGT